MPFWLGEWGKDVIVTIRNKGRRVEDLAAASILFRFTKPDGSNIDRTGIVSSPRGDVLYTLEEGELDQSGLWTLQVFTTYPNGLYRTTKRTFEVLQ